MPHFAALRGKEREIVILRSDNGESWKEHTVEATEDVLNEVLRESFETEGENINPQIFLIYSVNSIYWRRNVIENHIVSCLSIDNVATFERIIFWSVNRDFE